MVANPQANLLMQMCEKIGGGVDFDNIVVVRCLKASWEYDMSILTSSRVYPFHEDASLMFLRDLVLINSQGYKLVLLCDCGLDIRSCNQVQGYLTDKRRAAILHGIKCLLMLLRDKLILEKMLYQSELFYLATIDGDQIEIHHDALEQILTCVRNILQ